MGYLPSPEISVVIVTPDSFTTIRNTIACLSKQTAKDQMEVVIVSPSAECINTNSPELSAFRWVKIVELRNIESIAQGNAAGIRRATAPVVVLAEDHSFPTPDWAQALIEAHQQPWAAVGPVVYNANPGSAISWADFLIGYGHWIDPGRKGTVDHLPGHNSSYKSKVLLEYGSKLEGMLEAESVLHWDLRKKGYQLYLDPAAKIYHVNFGLMSSWIPVQFHGGRMFAATRAQYWSIPRRLLYAACSPLIPAVRFSRIVRKLKGSESPHNIPRGTFPALAIGLLVSALGEMLGYALGAGEAKQKLADLEFHRIRHISERDRLFIEDNEALKGL
ncbi:MAG TPA: glycosyltransferase [Thermodesulfobacteriota bacterium]|nr:glycosyltransferase [Thermodesulfobacteriota bacterium]